jgi:hypothetical protein
VLPPDSPQPEATLGVSSLDVYIDIIVRCNLKIAIAVGIILAAGRSLQATVPDVAVNQYDGIPQRNVFGLRPPQAPPPTAETPAALPKIILTGITTILDTKRALMKVAPANVRQVEPGKELSLILTEGQREGQVEVLQIDEKAGSVKVNNSGTVMVLTFEKDGAKLPPASTAHGVAATNPLPSSLPSTNPFSLPTHHDATNFPGRGRRFATPPLPGVAGAATGVPVGGVPSPTGVATVPGQTTSPALSQDLTAEEQAIVMELQRQANPNNAALIPPTALTPAPTVPPPAESPAPVATPNPALQGRPLTLVPQ